MNAKRGLTLIEVSVSMTIFGVLGLVLMQALHLSQGSHRAVANLADGNVVLREAADVICQDLRLSSDSMLSVSVLPDENHSVKFQVPVVDGGALSWGVPASEIGTPKEADLVGWSITYTVEEQSGHHNLVRQIWTDLAVQHSEEVIAEDVRLGTDDPPGFQVVKTGDVWEVTLSVDGDGEWSEVFHVWTRN